MATTDPHPKRDLYLALKSRLLSITGVEHVRLYNNQIQRDTVEEAYKQGNTVFVEFIQLTWTGAASGQQRGETVVRLHVVFESLLTEDVTLFERVQNVHLSIQGFNGPLFTSMQRTNEEQDTDHDNIIVWKADYITQLSDCTTDHRSGLDTHTITQVEINAQLDIDNEIVRSGDGDFTT
jgi:hypothetical protein